ncbi:MAG: hypothetical protein KC731_06590 [Myxococcales bacterium]|nr:hypothetical protein [Myxococcales bacterium]
MSDGELFYRLSAERLRSRCRIGGLILALGLVWPYEVVDEQPQLLWQIFYKLPPSAVIAAVAPALVGITLVVLERILKRTTSLAVVTLTSLVGLALLRRIGADAAAWELLPLPASLVDRAGLALLALAATAAGSNLSHREATRPSARVLLLLGFAAAVVFYAWPGRGEAVGLTVTRALASLGDMPTFRHQLGLLTLGTVALLPALVSTAGLLHLRRPAPRPLATLGLVALFGMPLLLVMLLFAWYLRASPGAAFFGAFGAALEISAALGLLAAALEVLGRSNDRAEGETPHRRVVLGSAAVAATLLAAQVWLARPPDKGVQWTLGAPTAAADQLFGEHIPAWSEARRRWERRLEVANGASELLDVKRRAAAMAEAGAGVDPRLAQAVGALGRAAYEPDISARRWYRLVAEVNGAVRTSGLPYYLDPQISIAKTGEGLRRHFVVDSYRVERVRRWSADGAEVAALFVRGFAARQAGHRVGALLGFSRDRQRFALVVLDAGEQHREELEAMASADPPNCGDALGPEERAASLVCGRALAAMVARGSLGEVALAGVERHELQHQLDGPLLPLASVVRKKLAGYAAEAQDRTNRELSAYLAELTSPTGPVALGLVVPFRFALLQRRGTYHHAAVLLFEALAQRRVRDAGRHVDPTTLGEVFQELADEGDEALRRRAAEAWARLYGRDLPALELIDQPS